MKSFVRFEHEEALTGKRELLSSELNLLNFFKKFKNYKNLRKRELILKTRLKRELASLKTKTKELEETFPQEAEEEFIIKKRGRRKKRKTEVSKDIESELQGIREKLASLG